MLIAVLLLCVGFGMLVVAYLCASIQQTLGQRPLEDNGKAPKQQGLSEADLQRLPTIECRKEEEGEERTPGGGEGECAVCLELFQIGDLCRVIPACSHAFHVDCADAWLSKRSVCPICRRSARESNEDKGVLVNGGPAVVLQAAEEHDEESGRSRPSATAGSVVVEIPIAITPRD